MTEVETSSLIVLMTINYLDNSKYTVTIRRWSDNADQYKRQSGREQKNTKWMWYVKTLYRRRQIGVVDRDGFFHYCNLSLDIDIQFACNRCTLIMLNCHHRSWFSRRCWGKSDSLSPNVACPSFLYLCLRNEISSVAAICWRLERGRESERAIQNEC